MIFLVVLCVGLFVDINNSVVQSVYVNNALRISFASDLMNYQLRVIELYLPIILFPTLRCILRKESIY